MTMTYDELIAMRVAFGHRRRELIDNWFTGTDGESRTYWAEKVMLVNDAEIAINRGLAAARAAAAPSRNELMDALYASLAGGAR